MSGARSRARQRRRSLGEVECCWCRKLLAASEATSDHKMPVAAGGAYTVDNLVFACQECNNRRGPAPFDAYLKAVEMMRAEGQIERPKFRRLADGSEVITVGPKKQPRILVVVAGGSG